MTTGEALRLTLSWLATYGLHSTLFLGGAWLLCRLRPPRIDRNRERLWKLALVGGVLSATLQLGLGAQSPLGSFELEALSASRSAPARAARPELAPEQRTNDDPPHTEPEAGAVELARNEARRPRTPLRGFAAALRPPLTGTAVEVARDAGRSVPEAAGGGSAGVASVGKESARSSSAGLSTHLGAFTRTLGARWPALVLALWVALGLAGVTGLVASWTCLRARMLGRERLSDGPLVERFERLHARARVRRRVRLSVSARIAAPFSTGLLLPEVCLPRAVLTDLTPAQQDALLAHELAHLLRRDPAWFGIGFLIEKLFFFQPLNRLARRQLSELAELACDDWAVRWTGARLALASCLTEVAGWVIGERARLVTPPGLAGHRSRLGQRVERLLDDRRSPAGEPAAPWWPPLAAGALALVALAGPGVSAARTARTRSVPASLARPELGVRELPAAPSETTAELAPAQRVLEDELALLERELSLLHAELEVHALREHFRDELAHIDARMQALHLQHRRVSELLALFARRKPIDPNTTAPVPPEAPTSDERLPGDLR